MKVIELRRHAPRAKDADALSPEGLELARAAGKTLPGTYTHYVSSGAERATQTLHAFVGDVRADIKRGLQSPVEDRWRAAGKAAGTSNLDRIAERDAGLVETEKERLASVVREIAAKLPAGSRALVIGHSPLIEAAVAGLTGRVIDPLKECEGVALTFEEDRVTSVEELRL